MPYLIDLLSQIPAVLINPLSQSRYTWNGHHTRGYVSRCNSSRSSFDGRPNEEGRRKFQIFKPVAPFKPLEKISHLGLAFGMSQLGPRHRSICSNGGRACYRSRRAHNDLARSALQYIHQRCRCRAIGAPEGNFDVCGSRRYASTSFPCTLLF